MPLRNEDKYKIVVENEPTKVTEIRDKILDTFNELVFVDAAKGQYLIWLPHLLKCLKTGGVLVSDNVLQEGAAAESRFALDRRERTIHARMRSYLYTLTHTEGLVTSVTPCGDGTALTVKTAKWTAFEEIESDMNRSLQR